MLSADINAMLSTCAEKRRSRHAGKEREAEAGGEAPGGDVRLGS